MKSEMEELKFPVGRYQKPTAFSPSKIDKWISGIESFPKRLKAEVLELSEEQLDTPYRPNGWTIRQVVHHCADSHMNSLIRFKLALTEDTPIIRPYYEDRWAELIDGKHFPIESSLHILEGVHLRWTSLLRNLTDQDLERTFIHPDQTDQITIAENIAIYAWHCHHHLSHITTLKARKQWK